MAARCVANDPAKIYDSQAIAGDTNGLAASACLRQVSRSDASSDLSTYPTAPTPSAARTKSRSAYTVRNTTFAREPVALSFRAASC